MYRQKQDKRKEREYEEEGNKTVKREKKYEEKEGKRQKSEN